MWSAMCRIDCEIYTPVSYDDEKLGSYRACVESKAKTKDSLSSWLAESDK